jgi:hypothetical protein
MQPTRRRVLNLLDRSIIGLLLFVMLVLLGIQVVHGG